MISLDKDPKLRGGYIPEFYSINPYQANARLELFKTQGPDSKIKQYISKLFCQEDIDNLLANIEADRVSAQTCFETQMNYVDKLRAAILAETPRIASFVRYNMVIAVNLHPDYLIQDYFEGHSRATFVVPLSYVKDPAERMRPLTFNGIFQSYNGVFDGSVKLIDDNRIYIVIQKPDKTHQFITDLATRLGADIWFYGYPLSKALNSPLNRWPTPRNTVTPSSTRIGADWVYNRMNSVPKNKIIRVTE